MELRLQVWLNLHTKNKARVDCASKSGILCQQYCSFFVQIMLKRRSLFKILCLTKIDKTVRKVSFINLLYYYYYCSPDFVCCFSGFKYPICGINSSLGSLQDLKVLGVCFGDGGRHLVTWSHLWEWDQEQGFLKFPFQGSPSKLKKTIPARPEASPTVYLESLLYV